MIINLRIAGCFLLFWGGTLSNTWSQNNWIEVADDVNWGVVSRYAIVSHNNSMWIIGGKNISNEPKKHVWKSSDGATWVQVNSATPLPMNIGYPVVSFDGAIWVLGGEEGC